MVKYVRFVTHDYALVTAVPSAFLFVVNTAANAQGLGSKSIKITLMAQGA